MKMILGYLLIALPFLVLSIIIVRTKGYRSLFSIWGGSLGIVGCIIFGGYLIGG